MRKEITPFMEFWNNFIIPNFFALTQSPFGIEYDCGNAY